MSKNFGSKITQKYFGNTIMGLKKNAKEIT